MGDEHQIAECGATISLAPESYNRRDDEFGPLTEWERAMWWPPWPGDSDWRFIHSGEYTSYLLEEYQKAENPPLSTEVQAKIRNSTEENYSTYGVFFEVARLGLLLPSYVNFMYDLLVTEKKKVGTKTRCKKVGHGKRKTRHVWPVP